uniref:Zn(2)-C6 fungal-type domain-containing protein n=1 Tax=Palpitomonas bilix TaxID=652834 RepID=A0A7S3FYG0_9EUKA|mmetsp:Transcript_10664/g.27918  ORF Transcript_10664/g.27918 Transcript_10664/m.27918 type:complete len:423 (+) Transcript_10664:809-2077(+)
MVGRKGQKNAKSDEKKEKREKSEDASPLKVQFKKGVHRRMKEYEAEKPAEDENSTSTTDTESKKRRAVKWACNHCKKAKASCDDERPCGRCKRLGLPDCADSEHSRRGRNTIRGLKAITSKAEAQMVKQMFGSENDSGVSHGSHGSHALHGHRLDAQGTFATTSGVPVQGESPAMALTPAAVPAFFSAAAVEDGRGAGEDGGGGGGRIRAVAGSLAEEVVFLRLLLSRVNETSPASTVSALQAVHELYKRGRLGEYAGTISSAFFIPARDEVEAACQEAMERLYSNQSWSTLGLRPSQILASRVVPPGESADPRLQDAASMYSARPVPPLAQPSHIPREWAVMKGGSAAIPPSLVSHEYGMGRRGGSSNEAERGGPPVSSIPHLQEGGQQGAEVRMGEGTPMWPLPVRNYRPPPYLPPFHPQ